jgi:F-type H+-transporting ATPase subunit b
MLIDWFTVSAQITNFVVLVWLLKRLLYKPVLDAMDRRERTVVAQLRDAEAMRERLLEEVRRESETLRKKWLATLQEERNAWREELAARVQREIFAIARQTLRDLAGEELEQRIAHVFLGRIRALTGEEKSRLVTCLETSRRPALIRSALDLPDSIRTRIEDTIKATLTPMVQLQFQTVPELLGGIELALDGHKIAWSIEGYLSSLEESVSQFVGTKPAGDDKSKGFKCQMTA